MPDDLIARFNEQEQQRYQKMLRLRERGVEPYPLRAARTHTAREAIDAFTRGMRARRAPRIWLDAALAQAEHFLVTLLFLFVESRDEVVSHGGSK